MGFRNPITTATDPLARQEAQQAQQTATQANAAAAAAVTAAAAAQAAADSATEAANHITSTQITDGAITTPKLAVGAVTAGTIAAGAVQAGAIAAGAVQAGTIAADAIDGLTLSGVIVRTAASGKRIQLLELSDGYGAIQLYASARNNESPGGIYGNEDASGRVVQFYGGADASGASLPALTLSRGSDGIARATLAQTQDFVCNAATVELGGALTTGKINGVTVSDSGWQALTLASGWSATVAQCRVLNGVFYFSIMATSAAAWAANALLFTAPTVGGRATNPAVRMDFLDIWSTTPGYVIVPVSGAAAIAQAGAAGAGVIVSGSWPI